MILDRALSTADAKFQTVRLSTGEEVTVSYGQYRAILATRRDQSDRAATFRALHETYQNSLNTYATFYNGVCQRDWFEARARGYKTTLDAALHGDNVPTSAVENLIETTRGRRAAAALSPASAQDARRALVPRLRLFDPARDVRPQLRIRAGTHWIVESVAPLGPEYQARMRQGFAGGWIDVYENDGKRSGAYSAPVYGTHPYMLLNYTDTLDDMFTLAHEMGHSMHTILSHASQPFVYSSKTIFVAEVPSTLSEALLLDYLLARSTDPAERVVLLHMRSTTSLAVLHAGAVRRLRVARPPARGKRSTHHRRDPDGDLPRAARRLLRRRARSERADGHHLGAHSAFLQLAGTTSISTQRALRRRHDWRSRS